MIGSARTAGAANKMRGQPRRPSRLILARGATQWEKTGGDSARVMREVYGEAGLARGMVSDFQRSAAKCFARNTIWPTWYE